MSEYIKYWKYLILICKGSGASIIKLFTGSLILQIGKLVRL